MNYAKSIATVLVLWSNTAASATLMWNANLESDLAGYRVYQCSQTPCTKTSGTASPLATLGKVTSFNIGTPAVTTHYFITAYDFANNESSGSSSVTFTAAASPLPLPPPPSTATVNLAVVGNPATGPWGVTATTSSTQDVMAKVFLDGALQHYDNFAPYSLPAIPYPETTLTPKLFGSGSHTVEFVFYLQSTTTEIGRASVTVVEGSPAPPPSAATVNLAVVGNPATGPWGVTATTTSTQDVMAKVFLDGALQHYDNVYPYSLPAIPYPETTLTPKLFGNGSHLVEFVFYLQSTTTEIGRANVTVVEGSPLRSPAATVNLTVVGNPATGPWGVTATTSSTQDVMAKVYLDGTLQHYDNVAPYSLPAIPYPGTTLTPALFGKGSHKVEFVFYLQNTTTEIGRASVTVLQGI